MKNELTQEEKDLMPVIRDKWIDLALNAGTHIDEEEVTSGVKWMYYLANLKEPEVVFVKGPKDFAEKLTASVGASVWASVRDSVRDSVWDSVRASVWASVRDSVRASVWASVGASVRDSVWASVGVSVRDSVGASVRDSVGDSVSWCSLAYDADWASWYDYYNKIGVVNHDKANKYLGYLKGGAFFAVMFEKKAFIMCRPEKVEQDDQKRLHSETSAALIFADGTEIYKLHGVTFEKEWWSKIVNDEMTPQEIFSIDNLEHRRIAYEYMDKTKMKSLEDYKVLDEVADDGYGYSMKVISFTIPNVDEPLKYLNCFCPSTGREYYLGTAQDTCIKAKSMSFGFDEIEFINEW
jgi:hypothetical protein